MCAEIRKSLIPYCYEANYVKQIWCRTSKTAVIIVFKAKVMFVDTEDGYYFHQNFYIFQQYFCYLFLSTILMTS